MNIRKLVSGVLIYKGMCFKYICLYLFNINIIKICKILFFEVFIERRFYYIIIYINNYFLN